MSEQSNQYGQPAVTSQPAGMSYEQALEQHRALQPQVQYVPVPVPSGPVTRPTSTAVIVTAWIVTFLTMFYMLPWAVAASRGKPNQR
jgi:hypothetical protein